MNELVEQETYIPIPNKFLNLHGFDSGDKNNYLVQVEHSHFQINKRLHDLIQLIDGKRSVEAIAEAYANQMGVDTSVDDILEIFDKILKPKHIVVDKDYVYSEEPKKSSYLYIQIPVLKERIAEKISAGLAFLFKPILFYTMLACILVMHVVFYGDVFKASHIDIDYIFSAKFLVLYLIANISLVWHELGHAASMKHYKLKHGDIGVGLYLYFIVMYTNVSNAWTLKRSERTVVNLAGYYFEGMIQIVCFGLYFLTNDIIYLIHIFLTDLKIIYGLIPFFRVDGYWVFSDMFGIPNLREKSIELMKYASSFFVFKPKKLPLFMQSTHTFQKWMLTIYSVSAFLFFAYILYYVIDLTLIYMVDIPEDIALIQSTFAKESSRFSEWVVIFQRVGMKCMLLAFLGIFGTRLVKTVLRNKVS